MSFLLKKPNMRIGICCPSKRIIMIILVLVVIIVASLLIYNYFIKGDDSVEYNVLTEEEVPVELLNEILPEYKQLERALACCFNDKIYVIVTRGEKPTGGYDIGISDMKLVNNDDETQTLVVYTTFTDPKPGDIVTQVITYPYEAAATDLVALPNEIEMKVEYNDNE